MKCSESPWFLGILIGPNCKKPLSILSDFEDKSQYIISQIQMSLSKTESESNFAPTAKKLQLIDSAACRLRFKLADEFNRHIFIYRTLKIL